MTNREIKRQKDRKNEKHREIKRHKDRKRDKHREIKRQKDRKNDKHRETKGKEERQTQRNRQRSETYGWTGGQTETSDVQTEGGEGGGRGQTGK